MRDKTIRLLRSGYLFTTLERLRRESTDGGDVMTLRLLGRPATVVRGPAGVRFFYDASRLHRKGAMPATVARPLFGRGAVHGLDGDQHRARKAMFVDLLMDPERVAALVSRADPLLRALLAPETGVRRVGIYDAAVEAYGRAVIRWAGISETPAAELRHARALAEIVDGFAVPGLPWLRAYRSRITSDRWAAGLVRGVRSGTTSAPSGSVLERIATHREADGQLLDDHTAGVELLNVLRPTVAVARFAAFLAVALVHAPEWRDRVAAEARERGDTHGGPVATAVAHEVRRLYPFVPFLAAVTSHSTEHEGCPLPAGRRVLLDVTATDRNPATWSEPHRFEPARFVGTGEEWSDHFVPQGGGGRAQTGHRCPGELIAVGLLALTAAQLSVLDISVPEQDLGWSLRRMPTRPRSGVLLDVHAAARSFDPATP